MNTVVRQIIETRLNTVINNLYPIEFDNTKILSKAGFPFLRCNVDQVFSNPIALSCDRDVYVVEIQVLTPFGEGTERNLDIAETIREGFRKYEEGYFHVIGSRIVRRGQFDEWHQRDVLIDAYYDNHY